MFLGLAGSVISHFPLLGHYVRPPHKAEVSVGDRKILLIDAFPHFPLGDGVWEVLTL